MLWKYELKKMLITQKGLLILAVCFLLEAVFLCAFPEQKDSRIKLSQKQYDKYLSQLYGESTSEKNDWILTEYETCKYLKEIEQDMQARYASGDLSEAEWRDYTTALQTAELHWNAVGIFAEKATQFLSQPQTLPPAHYIYEYGWQTVFTLLRYPNVFLLFGLLILSSQCFSFEASNGILPVLLSARNGRKKLYDTKLTALLTIGVFSCLWGSLMETGIFLLRGWCSDGGVPVYSVTVLYACRLDLTLWEAYAFCHLVRAAAVALFLTLLHGLSVWVPSAPNLIFLGLCILVLPLFLTGGSLLYSHSGLLCGSRMLMEIGDKTQNLAIPVMVVAAYSMLFAWLGRCRHGNGL